MYNMGELVLDDKRRLVAAAAMTEENSALASREGRGTTSLEESEPPNP